MTEGEIDACPACDGTYIYTRNGSAHGRMDDSAPTRFRCRECGEEFDEPNTRPSQRDHGTLRGLASKLDKADPDEVGL